MAKKNIKPTTPQRHIRQTKTTEKAENRSALTSNPNLMYIQFGFAVLSFLLYANTLGHGYVLDDPLAIAENEYVRQGIGGIPELLTHHYRAGTVGANASALLYRPLSLVTFAIEWSLSPGSPFLGHLMNVLWYAFTVALLFATLRRLFRGYHWLWAAGAVLLFTVHPLHTEVVANIKSRDEILNVFFSISALYGWVRWLDNPAPRWILASLGCYFLALLSKESAVTLLPVFPLAAWYFFGKTARQSGGYALLFALPLVLFLVIRTAVLAQSENLFEVSEMDNPIVAANGLGERSATAFMTLWKYFQLLIFPHPLLSDYSYRHLSVVGWGNWQALAGLAVYGALAILAVRGLARRQPLSFCIAAFMCSIALYSQLLLVIGTLLGERLMYMPSLWFCAGLAWLLWRLSGLDLKNEEETYRLPPIKTLQASIALLLLIVAFYSVKTISRNPDWKTNLVLFTADIAKAPSSVRLHNGIGSETYSQYLNEKENLGPEAKEALLTQIEQHSKAAIAIRPNPVSYLNLGNAAVARLQYAEAIRQYEEALKQAPKYGMARINIGRTYSAWGQEEGKVKRNYARAAELFEKAVEYGMNDAETYLNLGVANGLMGQSEKAIRYFEQAAALAPQNKGIWKNLGVAYRAVGNVAKAEECEAKAR